MSEKESLRKTIFQNELRYIFNKNQVNEYDENKIIQILFENPFDLSKQWLLKNDLLQHDQVVTKLKEIDIDNDVIVEISSLFVVHDDLRIPDDIKKLFVNNERVGVLVGSGVSRLLNMSSWKQLADKAIEHLYKSNRINFFEYQKIQTEMIDPKQKLTIFHNLISRNEDEVKKFYDKEFGNAEAEENPYDLLVKIDWIKLTSNIDKAFFKALERSYKKTTAVEPSGLADADTIHVGKIAKLESKNFDFKTIDYDTVYHIHGSLDAINDTILTTKDYLDNYHADSKLKKFLKSIFKEYTIIFIGYGLEEFSILEHIVKTPRQHFVLLPCYLHDINLFRIKNEYFKTLNIKAVPYYLDFDGYHRLYYVLKAWIDQITASLKSGYFDKIKKIDEVL